MKLVNLKRDPNERPNNDWLFGHYRWSVTAACSHCGKVVTGKAHGTRIEILEMVAEDRWLCRYCEDN